MTESSKDTKQPIPTKRIEMPSSFKDTTKPGTHEIFIGIHRPPPKPEQAKSSLGPEE
jgi:hypothetical protein